MRRGVRQGSEFHRRGVRPTRATSRSRKTEGGDIEICEDGIDDAVVGLGDVADQGLRVATRINTSKYEYYVYMYFGQNKYFNSVKQHLDINIYAVAHFWFFVLGLCGRKAPGGRSSEVGGFRGQFRRGCNKGRTAPRVWADRIYD